MAIRMNHNNKSASATAGTHTHTQVDKVKEKEGRPRLRWPDSFSDSPTVNWAMELFARQHYRPTMILLSLPPLFRSGALSISF